MALIEDTVVYTSRDPLIREGRTFVSIEALTPGDVVRVRRYGYVGDVAPPGDYFGFLLSRCEEPWMGRDEMVGYRMRFVLSGGEGVHLDEVFLIEGSILEWVAGGVNIAVDGVR